MFLEILKRNSLYIIFLALLCLYVSQKIQKSQKKEGFAMEQVIKNPGSGYVTLLGKSRVEDGILKIHYPKGSGGEFEIPGGVMGSFRPPEMKSNARSIVYSVDVLYQNGFDFGLGGKMGIGIQMGTGNASGGLHSTTASTCRVIFRPGGAATVYVYVPYGSKQVDPNLISISSGAQTYGSEFFIKEFPPGTLTPGKYQRISLGVKMNNPGKVDGGMFLKIGDKCAEKRGIMWLNDMNNKEGITRILIGTFFGGENWYSPKTQWCSMKNFTISSIL